VIGENMNAQKYDLSIVVPAMDANDRSFCEDVKTTEEYLKIRSELIAANSIEIWLAEYQQEPAEVQGLLFRKSDIKRFTPDDVKDVQTVLGYIDPAEGGGDALGGLFGKIVKGKVFITDVIYSSETVEVSVPRCADLAAKVDANYIRIEKNGLGSGFIRDMRRLYSPERIYPVSNSTHKGTRIWNEYGFIQKYFYFLEEKEYIPGSDYDKFMRNLFSYMKIGDNQQDAAPDATAGLSRMIQSFPQTKQLFTDVTNG